MTQRTGRNHKGCDRLRQAMLLLSSVFRGSKHDVPVPLRARTRAPDFANACLCVELLKSLQTPVICLFDAGQAVTTQHELTGLRAPVRLGLHATRCTLIGKQLFLRPRAPAAPVGTEAPLRTDVTKNAIASLGNKGERVFYAALRTRNVKQHTRRSLCFRWGGDLT
jgi:hypothetical protein